MENNSTIYGLETDIMLVRRPPRRVSRRTIQRYSAIRKFFRRALGSISRPSTSIILSESNYTVTELKHRIIDLEQTLSEVTKRYPNLNSIEESDSARTETQTTIESLASSKDKGSENKKTQSSVFSLTNSSKKSSKLASNRSKIHKEKQNLDDFNKYFPRNSKRDKHMKSIVTAFKSDKMHNMSALHGKNVESVFSASSCETQIQNPIKKPKKRSKHHESKKPLEEEDLSARDMYLTDKDIPTPDNSDYNKNRDRKYKSLSPGREEKNEKLEKRTKMPKQRSDKNEFPELDQTFITDIIRKQYRPIKLGRGKSEMSQFSVPVCRDRVSRSKATRVKDPNESSCLDHADPYKCEENTFNELPNIYNTKQYKYSSMPRSKNKSKHPQVYNDSALYDLVPVKEKPESPLSCRFMLPEDKQPDKLYKEVPPSPRSQRPRLNLTAHYSDYEEVEDMKADDKPNVTDCFNRLVTKINLSSLSNEPSDDAANSSNEVVRLDACDKTQETLLEIKETLQQFLEDFKKENSTHNLQDNCYTGVTSSSCLMHKYPFAANNVMPPMLPNSCYYPMAMPICPMNCMPPTCPVANNCNFTSSQENLQREQEQADKKPEKDSTVELIREIYKCVASKQESCEKSDLDPIKQENQEPKSEQPQPDVKILTSRSVGSSKASLFEPDNNQFIAQSICRSSSFETLNTKITSNLYEDLSKELYYSETRINTSDTDMSLEKPVSSGTVIFEKKAKINRFKKIFNFLANKKEKAPKDTDSVGSESGKVKSSTALSKVTNSHSVINYPLHGLRYVTHQSQYPNNYQRVNYQRDNYQRDNYQRDNYQRDNYQRDNYQRDNYQRDNYHRDNYQRDNYIHPVYSSCSDRGMSSVHSYVQPTAPPYAMSLSTQNTKPGHIPMRTKQIELKCTATQSDTVPFYLKVAKLFQAPKGPNTSGKANPPNNAVNNFPVQPSINAPANFTSLPPIAQVPGPTGQLFDWKKLQTKLLKPEMDLKGISMMQKENLMFQKTNENLQKQLMKKLGQSKNPFSVKNMLRKALLTNTPAHQKMMYKPKFGFF